MLHLLPAPRHELWDYKRDMFAQALTHAAINKSAVAI